MLQMEEHIEQESREEQLGSYLMLEEFRYWDACRNDVPEQTLNEIKDNIKKLKAEISAYILD